MIREERFWLKIDDYLAAIMYELVINIHSNFIILELTAFQRKMYSWEKTIISTN